MGTSARKSAAPAAGAVVGNADRLAAAATRSLWARLAGPVPTEALRFRPDGKIVKRDGRAGQGPTYHQRHVVYVDAAFVRERLDQEAAGDWTLRLRRLPATDIVDASTGEVKGREVSFLARLTVAGVVRESVGTGKDYKAAETDAFKRAGARFGIGASIKELPQVWVAMDGDGRYAKATQNPLDVYTEKLRQLRPAREG